MSRIGEMPIKIPDGVEVKIGPKDATVKGPKGTLSCVTNSQIKLKDVDASFNAKPKFFKYCTFDLLP